MAENNNNGGKNTNIITKINDTISKVLGNFPPVVQTIAKIVVFGGLILLIAKAIGYIFPVIVNVLFNLLVKIVGFCILDQFQTDRTSGITGRCVQSLCTFPDFSIGNGCLLRGTVAA